jgi:hypothetical protein
VPDPSGFAADAAPEVIKAGARKSIEPIGRPTIRRDMSENRTL